jgi:hypothetical protein
MTARLRRAIDIVALLAGVWYLAIYAILAVIRARYPFQLEWMEGAIEDQVRQVAAGHPLYTAPSIAFVPFQYPPLYFYAAALLTRVAGPGFAPLRILSIAASVGCFGILFALVRRESNSSKAAFLAVTLFAACFRFDGAWYDLARIDSLFLWLVFGAAYLARFHDSRVGVAACGALFALACLTKQSALVVAAPVLVYMLVDGWRDGLLAIALFVTLLGGATWALNVAHHGWFLYYVLRMPARMQRVDPVNVAFWRGYLLRSLPIAVLVGLGYLAWAVRRRATAYRFYVALTVGLIGSAWLSMRHAGAYDNNLIPAALALAVLAGLAIGAEKAGSYVTALCAVQLALLFYDPRAQLPSAGSRQAGRHLVSLIGSSAGDVLAPQDGYLGAFADKPTFAHSMAIYDVMRAGDPDDAARLVREFHEALSAHRFSLIVVDRIDPWLRDDLQREYRRDGPAIADDRAFWPVTGLHLHPAAIYRPR